MRSFSRYDDHPLWRTVNVFPAYLDSYVRVWITKVLVSLSVEDKTEAKVGT